MEGRLMIQFAWKWKQSAKSKLCSKLSREVCVVCHYLEGDLTPAPPLVTGWTHWALIPWDGWGDFTVFHLEGKWPWEIGCHFILKPYLPRWGHRLHSTSNEEPRQWQEAHSREFSLMPCFPRLLIGIHTAKWKPMKCTLCFPDGGLCVSLFLITVCRTEDAGGDYYPCKSQQSPAIGWHCPHMVPSSLLSLDMCRRRECTQETMLCQGDWFPCLLCLFPGLPGLPVGSLCQCLVLD